MENLAEKLETSEWKIGVLQKFDHDTGELPVDEAMDWLVMAWWISGALGVTF